MISDISIGVDYNNWFQMLISLVNDGEFAKCNSNINLKCKSKTYILSNKKTNLNG